MLKKKRRPSSGLLERSTEKPRKKTSGWSRLLVNPKVSHRICIILSRKVVKKKMEETQTNAFIRSVCQNFPGTIAHEKGPRINRHVDGEVWATIYLSQQGGLGNSKLPVVGIQLSLKRISELSRPERRGDQEERLLQEMETEAVDRVHMYSIKVLTCLRPSNWGV
ncbi:hypothetical protein ALC53_05994 [Atta colombica]|uniref:Uncharacterized protein n=1 Tax=Atta colombica TaxID=520822 RepID=A0A195BHG5_9HYME|nr:hypothetical protein ALC53_05994 [Atta colombica]